MNVAIDVSPLQDSKLLQHRVRGTGFYIENLKSSLLKYFHKNTYIFFTRGEKLPNNIDLVHYPYFEPFFRTLPLIKRYKTVVTVHDLIPLVFPKEFPVGLKGKFKWQVQKLALRRSDAIITDSVSSKNNIVEYAGIPASKIYVIYLAASDVFEKMDKSLILGCIREKYKLPEKFVLYVGDVTWNKNLPRLMKAIKKTNIPLVMVGRALVEKDFDKYNPWNQDLLEVQKLVENDDKIIRLGFVSQDELVMLYNIATVFAMPSLYEGFGLPVLEAMNCGCPVVTSKEGSIPEIAGNACVRVDAYSVDSIAQCINKVFNDQNLQKDLSDKGNKQSKKFTWRKTSDNTTDVYKSVVVNI